MKDTRARSLVKGISWRALGTIDTFIVAGLLFGDPFSAAKIAGTEVITKIILYYLHERGWNFISWGRVGHHPTNTRSVVKGLSWRAVGTVDTTILSWFYTGQVLGAIQMGGAEVITKLALYYVHERLWALTNWGRIFEDEIKTETPKVKIKNKIQKPESEML